MEKEYFQAQFLLDLPAAGYYTVQVDARLLDNEGRVWDMGYKAKMNVVVEGDENFKPQQKQRDMSVGGKGGSSKVISS